MALTRRALGGLTIGGTAAFLCSDDAAQITGTTISVDGGWTAM